MTAYAHLGQAFLRETERIAREIGADPYALLAVMDFETGGTFSPSISNPASTATGLLQFLESTARGMGTSTAELARMTREQQLVYVRRYLLPYRGRVQALDDLYMAVLWPVAVGKPPEYVLFRAGDGRYERNRALDANGDGTVTKAEAAARVRSRYKGPDPSLPASPLPWLLLAGGAAWGTYTLLKNVRA